MHFSIYYCRFDDDYDDAFLDRFVEKLNTLVPMAKLKDQTEESKVIYLKYSFMGLNGASERQRE